MRAYLRGVNAQYRDADRAYKRFTLIDFMAASGFIGSIFGRGGGDEARRSLFLDALRDKLGERAGHGGLERPAELQRPEAPVIGLEARELGVDSERGTGQRRPRRRLVPARAVRDRARP